jgi:hypothetical protein
MSFHVAGLQPRLNYSISHYQDPNSLIFWHTEAHQKSLLQIQSIEENSNQKAQGIEV